MNSTWRLGMRGAVVCLVLMATAAALALQPAHARMRALLVGVSQYPNLAARYQLEGPRNDVRELRSVLLRQGFATTDITVLADGPDMTAADWPTRERILAALDNLAATANAGDFTLVYMAGHGSRQPATPDIPSGEPWRPMEPIFLPRDAGAWDATTHATAPTVRNAIRNLELRHAIDRVREQGSFVWAVFDTCHADRLVRGVATSAVMRARRVPPETLNIPVSAASLSRPPTPIGSTVFSQSYPLGRKLGGGVYFYAAQADELAVEMPLPGIDAMERMPHGVFSNTWMRLLASGRPMTYRQMSQAILTRYAQMPDVDATPAFSGDALDAAVWDRNIAHADQWPLEPGMPLTVRAGTLAGLRIGTLLTLAPSPLADADAIEGYAVVTRASTMVAELTPVSRLGKPALRLADLAPSTVVRLTAGAMGDALRVAIDEDGCVRVCAGEQILQTLQADGIAGADIQWVRINDAPEVVLYVSANGFRLTSPMASSTGCTGPIDGGRGCSLASGITIAIDAAANVSTQVARLAKAMQTAARAEALWRLAASDSEAQHLEKSGSELTVLPLHGSTRQLVSGRAEAVHAGDRLRLVLKAPLETASDVTVLWLDSAYGITPLFPPGDGASNRLEHGEQVGPIDIRINADTLGRERLLVLFSEARKDGERVDLSFLAQPGIDILRDVTATRSGGGLWGDAPRNGAGALARASLRVRALDFEVLP